MGTAGRHGLLRFWMHTGWGGVRSRVRRCVWWHAELPCWHRQPQPSFFRNFFFALPAMRRQTGSAASFQRNMDKLRSDFDNMQNQIKKTLRQISGNHRRLMERAEQIRQDEEEERREAEREAMLEARRASKLAERAAKRAEKKKTTTAQRSPLSPKSSVGYPCPDTCELMTRLLLERGNPSGSMPLSGLIAYIQPWLTNEAMAVKVQNLVDTILTHVPGTVETVALRANWDYRVSIEAESLARARHIPLAAIKYALSPSCAEIGVHDVANYRILFPKAPPPS